MTANQVLEAFKNQGFKPSTLTKNKKGNFVYRREFFYTGGTSSTKISQAIMAKFKNIEIVETDDIWKPFKGGAPTAKSSHFMVEFKINGEVLLPAE